MGNVTHILPVLHCLKRGIAFVSSLFIFLKTLSAVDRFGAQLSYFHKTWCCNMLLPPSRPEPTGS